MQREAKVVGRQTVETDNSTTDVYATTLLQRMGKLEDTLAEARMHMSSPSPIVGFGKKRNYQEGHAHSQISATPSLAEPDPIDYV